MKSEFLAMEHLHFELANLVDFIHTMIEEGVDLDLTTSGISVLWRRATSVLISIVLQYVALTWLQQTCVVLSELVFHHLLLYVETISFVLYSYCPISLCFWNILALLWNLFCLWPFLVSWFLYFLEDGRYFKAWLGYDVLSKLYSVSLWSFLSSFSFWSLFFFGCYILFTIYSYYFQLLTYQWFVRPSCL